jgi:hypothetical protein
MTAERSRIPGVRSDLSDNDTLIVALDGPAPERKTTITSLLPSPKAGSILSGPAPLLCLSCVLTCFLVVKLALEVLCTR